MRVEQSRRQRQPAFDLDLSLRMRLMFQLAVRASPGTVFALCGQVEVSAGPGQRCKGQKDEPDDEVETLKFPTCAQLHHS